MGGTCGAVTGAFMVIGLRHAKTRDGDDEAREKAYALVHAFTERFRKRNRSVLCRELLGYDLSTPDGMQAVVDKNLLITLCPVLVQSASEILEEILR